MIEMFKPLPMERCAGCGVVFGADDPAAPECGAYQILPANGADPIVRFNYPLCGACWSRWAMDLDFQEHCDKAVVAWLEMNTVLERSRTDRG
jgi:hypothetical protein